MKINHLLLATLFAGVLLGGCKGKDGDPGPAGATGAQGPAGTSGQNLTGNLTGFVNAVDENGASIGKSGVVVSIDGTNPAVTATSDADGKYTFASLKNGTYNLTYLRSGLATFHRYGVGHVGGDQPTYLGTLTLSQVSTQSVPSFTASANPTTGIVALSVTVTSPTPTTTFRYALFAATGTPVNATTGSLVFTSSIITTAPTTSYTFQTSLTRASLNNLGFASGTTVNLAAYGSTASLASYSDPATGKFVYPALGTVSSPIATVVVP